MNMNNIFGIYSICSNNVTQKRTKVETSVTKSSTRIYIIISNNDKIGTKLNPQYRYTHNDLLLNRFHFVRYFHRWPNKIK